MLIKKKTVLDEEEMSLRFFKRAVFDLDVEALTQRERLGLSVCPKIKSMLTL